MAASQNPFYLMKKNFATSFFLPGELTQQPLTDLQKTLVRKLGVSMEQITKQMQTDQQVTFGRYELYTEEMRAIDHWMVGAATKLYAEFVTNYSQMHDSTVWITSDSPTYERQIRKMFDTIGLEEKIFDWAYSIAAFGDLFVKVNAAPGVGIISVEDDDHPLNISRVDIDGVLAGFYHTPLGYVQTGIGEGELPILPPWEYIHFRLLGARKRRNLAGDPMANEFRSIHLLGGGTDRQITSKYGTSLIVDALTPYKRLRLAEDSVLLARLTRGIMRYIYKIKVDSTNMEAVASLMDQYVGMLKHARSFDTSGSGFFDSKANPFSSMEDILLPVWNDSGDISIEKIGGEPDIRWIVDVTELRNQLACALKCPLALLGAYIQEASGQLGDQAIEQLDIGFAKNSRRLQRTLIEGLTRMAQIHISYMNMDPDPELFALHMSQTSTAEEESLKKSLDTGMDVVQKLLDVLADVAPDLDKKKFFNFINQKLLKLEGLDLAEFQQGLKEGKLHAKDIDAVAHQLMRVLESRGSTRKEILASTDLRSYLPITEKCMNYHRVGKWRKDIWEKNIQPLKIVYKGRPEKSI